MDDILDTNMSGQSLGVGQASRAFLMETAKWSKFLSIVGFVMIGLFVILAIVMGFFMSSQFSELPGAVGAFGGIGIAVMYLLIGLFYFFPCLYLYRFATKMKVAINNNNQLAMDESFRNLKSCFKFMGILALIMLVLYGVVFVFGIGAGLMSSLF